jgi:hypothetical protein
MANNLSAYAQKAMLDWVLLGATPTRPTTTAVGLSLGSPTSVAGSEVGTASGYTVVGATWSAAATPATSGTTKNVNAMTFGSFLTAQSISGVIIKDTVATGGNMLWQGLLATARTVGVGDQLVFNVDAITVTVI